MTPPDRSGFVRLGFIALDLLYSLAYVVDN